MNKSHCHYRFPGNGRLLAGLTCFSSLLVVVLVSACTPATSLPAPEFTDAPIAEISLAAPPTEMDDGVRLAPPTPSWDGYGEVVAVHNDVLVIGASEWNPCGPGSAYVYRFSDGEWRAEAQLMASDRETFGQQALQFQSQRFGSSVAVAGNLIAVGAPGNTYPAAGDYVGAVYLFEYDGQTWLETAKVTPDPPDIDTLPPPPGGPSICSRTQRHSFGARVALDGDTLAVAVHPGGDSGSDVVYVYQRDGADWREQARLPVPDLPDRELHLVSMALFGDTLALSAFYVLPEAEENPFSLLSGSVTVYAFERTGADWEERFRFVPDGGEVDYLFLNEVNIGASVALSGADGRAELLAVGLPGFPDWSETRDHMVFGPIPDPDRPGMPVSNRQAGSVTLFERSEEGAWQPQVTLMPAGWQNPPGPGTLFAEPPPTPAEETESSGADGFSAAAGFPEGIVFPGHILSAEPEISFFGATVALDGNRLAVTAGFANATYLFERRDEGWVYRSKFTPRREDGGMWEDFAQVVAINGDTLLLGTPGEFGNSAYVFNLGGATHER
jgi:hypothetical protein